LHRIRFYDSLSDIVILLIWFNGFFAAIADTKIKVCTVEAA